MARLGTPGQPDPRVEGKIELGELIMAFLLFDFDTAGSLEVNHGGFAAEFPAPTDDHPPIYVNGLLRLIPLQPRLQGTPRCHARSLPHSLLSVRTIRRAGYGPPRDARTARPSSRRKDRARRAHHGFSAL